MRKQIIDQLAHFLLAYGVVAMLGLLGASLPPAAGALIGFALGATREITEGGNVVSRGSLTDMVFWTLGGLVSVIL